MAHLDLALGVVRGRSPALAARYLLVEARGSRRPRHAADTVAAQARQGVRELRGR
jgi:hypothetical protein